MAEKKRSFPATRYGVTKKISNEMLNTISKDANLLSLPLFTILSAGNSLERECRNRLIIISVFRQRKLLSLSSNFENLF